MIGLFRRLLGIDQLERLTTVPEHRDRQDALRSAERARALARRIRQDQDLRDELALRLAVIRRERGRR